VAASGSLRTKPLFSAACWARCTGHPGSPAKPYAHGMRCRGPPAGRGTPRAAPASHPPPPQTSPRSPRRWVRRERRARPRVRPLAAAPAPAAAAGAQAPPDLPPAPSSGCKIAPALGSQHAGIGRGSGQVDQQTRGHSGSLVRPPRPRAAESAPSLSKAITPMPASGVRAAAPCTLTQPMSAELGGP